MKRTGMKKFFALIFALMMVFSVMPLTAEADETYTQTDAYALNWAGKYGKYRFEYSTMYNPLLSYEYAPEDSYYERTGVNPLYNIANPEDYISVYCVDEYTGLNYNGFYQRLNLEDSTYFSDEVAQKLRSIMLYGFPKKSVEDLAEAAKVEGLTLGEAVHATQLAIWKTSYGDDFTIVDILGQIEPNTTWFTRNTCMNYDASYDEYKTGYASMDNKETIVSHVQAVYDYLMNLKPTAPTGETVSKASFLDWSKGTTLIDNKDGTFDVTVEAKVMVVENAGDNLTISAVLGDYFVTEDLANGQQDMTLILKNVPASKAKGTVRIAIDGTQKVSDVYLYTVEGDRETSQSLIGYSALQLPVHAEVEASPERIINFVKTGGSDKTAGVPLEGIEFELYFVADRSDYLSGKVKLPETIDVDSLTGKGDFYPEYVAVTDESGTATVNLTRLGLPDGVYVVVEKEHPAIIEPVAPFYLIMPATSSDGKEMVYTIDVAPKNQVRDEIDIVKDVISLGNDEASVDAYKAHTWIISSSIPADIGNAKKYVISDTLDNRLDFLGNIVVQVESAEGETVYTVLTQEKDYILTVTDNDSVEGEKLQDAFAVALTKEGMKKTADAVQNVSDVIRVYFDAQINANAELGVDIPNRAVIEYTNSVGVDFEDESDIPVVYTGGIKLVKVDAGNHEMTLKDAEFELYRIATEEEINDENVTTVQLNVDDKVLEMVKVEFFTNETLTGDKVTSVTTNEKGEALLYGLTLSGVNANYYLVETKAPAGYNLLSDPVGMTINRVSHLDANAVVVENYSGALLPETGGMGTMFFTMSGLILMLGAGIFLVTGRRMREV